MSEKKSALVTILLAVMTVTLLLCLYALKFHILFFMIGAVFATVGLVTAAVKFCGWLMEKKDELKPVEIKPDEDVDLTYEAIRDSLREELGE